MFKLLFDIYSIIKPRIDISIQLNIWHFNHIQTWNKIFVKDVWENEIVQILWNMFIRQVKTTLQLIKQNENHENDRNSENVKKNCHFRLKCPYLFLQIKSFKCTIRKL